MEFRIPYLGSEPFTTLQNDALLRYCSASDGKPRDLWYNSSFKHVFQRNTVFLHLIRASKSKVFNICVEQAHISERIKSLTRRISSLYTRVISQCFHNIEFTLCHAEIVNGSSQITSLRSLEISSICLHATNPIWL